VKKKKKEKLGTIFLKPFEKGTHRLPARGPPASANKRDTEFSLRVGTQERGSKKDFTLAALFETLQSGAVSSKDNQRLYIDTNKGAADLARPGGTRFAIRAGRAG